MNRIYSVGVSQNHVFKGLGLEGAWCAQGPGSKWVWWQQRQWALLTHSQWLSGWHWGPIPYHFFFEVGLRCKK